MTQTVTNRAFARRPPANLRNVRIILIEPRTPGNIGSTARAINDEAFNRSSSTPNRSAT